MRATPSLAIRALRRLPLIAILVEAEEGNVVLVPLAASFRQIPALTEPTRALATPAMAVGTQFAPAPTFDKEAIQCSRVTVARKSQTQ